MRSLCGTYGKSESGRCPRPGTRVDMANFVAERHPVETAQFGQDVFAPSAQARHQRLAEASRVFAGGTVAFQLPAAQVVVKPGVVEQASVQRVHQLGIPLLTGELHGADKLVHLRL